MAEEDKVVGLFEGRNVYSDGRGGFEVLIHLKNGEERRPLRVQDYSRIVFFADVSVGRIASAGSALTLRRPVAVAEHASSPIHAPTHSTISHSHEERFVRSSDDTHTNSCPLPTVPTLTHMTAVPADGGDAGGGGQHSPSSIVLERLGVSTEVLQMGVGPSPKVGQRVKYDWTVLRDSFDGHEIVFDYRGLMRTISFPQSNPVISIILEALLMMGVGEVRRITIPDELYKEMTGERVAGYYELRLRQIF
ncbi:unnamed protein product [Vitrella brassicaformis CCMP3155]|uniref:Uncharacterized protein n=2 Tax=Vitrella brassicaformis TaxID=1169539 RepID=A0A0G4GPN1_VITBC|nr:unnamed protein product [Vitrella brassicaformis CCMP3155]|mmetsp:Transcript_14486/g.41734  ORF Transcript_14486/g.41734 Transcript_14486/m.41734 type:complete len:249 (+) Transcript_14486:176-922(+)|eukprot:CEM32309.1 unnamed protein product [Vitrella brassicaformis CCMP3155]